MIVTNELFSQMCISVLTTYIVYKKIVVLSKDKINIKSFLSIWFVITFFLFCLQINKNDIYVSIQNCPIDTLPIIFLVFTTILINLYMIVLQFKNSKELDYDYILYFGSFVSCNVTTLNLFLLIITKICNGD